MSVSLVPKQILEDFKQESTQLLTELSSVVEKLEYWQGPFPKLELVDFAMKVDKILAASKKIKNYMPGHNGFKAIGEIAAVCKYLGHKANEKPNPALVPVLAAFWADSVDYLQDLVEAIDKPRDSDKVVKKVGDVLVKRLEWAVRKMNPHRQDITLKNLDIEDVVTKVG
jgi:hypothetical protein